MKTLSLILAASIFFSHTVFAQEAVPVQSTEDAVRALILDKKARLKVEQEEVAKVSQDLKRMKSELDSAESEDELYTILFAGGIVGGIVTVTAHAVLKVEHGRLSKRAVAILAVAYVATVASTAYGSKGFKLESKKKKLKAAIEKAEAAVISYEQSIKVDQRAVEELERTLYR